MRSFPEFSVTVPVAFVAVLVAVVVVTLAWPSPGPVSSGAVPPAMTLSSPSKAFVGGTFTVSINAAPAPNVEISGFTTEVLFDDGLLWLQRPACTDEVLIGRVDGGQLSLCESFFSPTLNSPALTGAAHVVVSEFASPPLAPLTLPPSTMAPIVEIDFMCIVEGSHKLTLTAAPDSPFGALFGDTNQEQIEVATFAHEYDGDGVQHQVADTATVDCQPAASAPTPTPLPPEHDSINGTVTEEGTGTPLGDICVRAHQEFFTFGEAITDSSGAYTIDGLPPGSYKLEFFDCVSPVTHVPEWYNDQHTFDLATPVVVIQGEKTGPIDAALAIGGTINGTVTEEGTGTPIAEICVSAESEKIPVDDEASFHFFAIPDSSGAYTIGGLPTGNVRVEFRDCFDPVTYVREWYSDQPTFDLATPVAVTQGEKTGAIDAALAIGGTINGTVTEEGTGTPLSFICVSAEKESSSAGGSCLDFTDSSGAYSIGGLAAGNYKVHFTGFNYVAEWYDDQPDFDSATMVLVTQGEKTGAIDAALASAPTPPVFGFGSINGTVTEEGTGAPLAEICVFAADDFFFSTGFATTDSSGAYTIDIDEPLSDSYRVHFSDCGSPVTYVPEWYNDQPTFDLATPVAVAAGEKTGPIDAALAIGGSINGTVTDEGTGTPLANICVSAADELFSGFFGSSVTDASGAYSIGGLPSGSYRARFSDCGASVTYVAEWYNDQPTFDLATPVAVTQGVKTGPIDAALVIGGTINGTVTDEGTGAPLANACVFAVAETSSAGVSGITDSAGA